MFTAAGGRQEAQNRLVCITNKSAGAQELGTNRLQEAYLQSILVLYVQVTYRHPPASTE